MKFDNALWDGSDPLYAPGISWKGRDPNKMTAWWKPTKKYKDAGYAVQPIKLLPVGHKGDEHQAQRALRCRELTLEMVRWHEGLDDPQQIDPDTWKYLIGRYRTDEFSPMNETKGNTRQGYVEQLVKVENVLGKTKISGTTFEVIKTIQRAMQDKGRSKDYINRFFSTLRRVARYGIVLGRDVSTKVAAILSEMKFAKGKPRNVAPTREQVYAVIRQADLEGSKHFALGLMIQYELGFRAVSVRGQWLPDDGKSGGIVRNGRRWQDGLTWDMFNADLTELEHTNSKTGEYLEEQHYYDLTRLPEIRKRLLQIRPKTQLARSSWRGAAVGCPSPRMAGVMHGTGTVITHAYLQMYGRWIYGPVQLPRLE